MALRTRQPTGEIAFPLVLLEGDHKTGKTYAALELSKSEKIGRSFVLELDEPTADEYAVLGDFEIIEHNGTYSDILDQLKEACAVPMEDGKPNALILDTGSALWQLLKDWASSRARNSEKNRKILAKDPDADIDTTMNLWNDAKDRWYEVLNLLRFWPGVAVIVARGREVSKVVDGRPVSGQVEWSSEVEKSTPFAVSAVVRMTAGHIASLMSARSLHVDVPARGMKIESDRPLEHVIFDVLGAGGDFQVSSAVVPTVGLSSAQVKTALVDRLTQSAGGKSAATEEAAALWEAAGLVGLKEINESQSAAVWGLAANRITELTTERKADNESGQ